MDQPGRQRCGLVEFTPSKPPFDDRMVVGQCIQKQPVLVDAGLYRVSGRWRQKRQHWVVRTDLMQLGEIQTKRSAQFGALRIKAWI
ncbi:hypothetical protein D3C75_863170 [compost metagenome]